MGQLQIYIGYPVTRGAHISDKLIMSSSKLSKYAQSLYIKRRAAHDAVSVQNPASEFKHDKIMVRNVRL